MQECIIILGMHRSGTSALTGVLGLLGIGLGLNLMKPTEENPKGYFENQEVNEINEAILWQVDSSWHDLFPLQKDWWKQEGISAFREKALKLIQMEFTGVDTFCIKDPRMCVLFPFWNSIFEELGTKLSYIIPVRNPTEVGDSLKRRHGLSIQKGIILWMNHILNAEFYSRSGPRSFVFFEQLLKNPEKTINRISKALGINFPKTWQEAKNDIEEFLEPSLKHYNHENHASSKDILPLVTGCYQLFFELCYAERTGENKLVKIDRIRKNYNEVYRLFYNQDLQRDTRETNLLLKEQAHRLKEAHMRLSDLQSQVQDKENRLAQVDRLLKEKDSELEGLYAKFTDQNLRLQQANIQLQDERSRVEMNDRLLREIFGSKGWRWLSQYRKLKLKFMAKKAAGLNRGDLTASDKSYRVHILQPLQKQRPKIIHAIGNIMTGGSTQMVVDLIEYLGHKYDQEVITNFAPSPAAYTGFPYHVFSKPATPEDIAGFLRERAADILHIHYWGEPWYRKVFEAARNCTCRVVENINTPREPFIQDGIEKYIFVSNYVMNLSSAPDRSAVIYPGSDLKMFQRGGAPIPDDAIGMVYRLEEDKLMEDSIQVFIKVVKKRPQTKAYIVGGGTLFDSYRNQAINEGVAENFVFTGYVAYETLPEYYRKLSLFVAPVWSESFGQVSPFAMSMKIPVVGYNIGALPEILGSADCLRKDPTKLAELIIGLLDDRQKRIEIGTANYARACDFFSIENMIRKYDLLYSRLVK
jgi:hypothetical protein